MDDSDMPMNDLLTKWLASIVASQEKSLTHIQRVEVVNRKVAESEGAFLAVIIDFANRNRDIDLGERAQKLLDNRMRLLEEWRETIADIHGDSAEVGRVVLDILGVLREMVQKTMEKGDNQA